MEKRTFEEVMGWLQKYHSRKLTPDTRKIYQERLKGIADDDFCAAIQDHYDTFPPGKFPTIGDIIKLVGDVRQKNWMKEKRNAPTMVAPPKTTMGLESLALMKRLKLHAGYPDKLTPRGMAVYMMTDMELKYPDMGWIEKGQELAQHLENREKVMEKRNAKAEQEKISE